ncbi:uncharacterized protein METZ01_LOCUS103091 [marine metagenome]|uniref:Uncharacterized protein n=1 Tax=marine metagenome TaxID=408172 RepID=A0A381WE50_9ZZZZ
MSVDIFGYCDPSVTHVSIPETLIPEGNKSRVSGDGLESNYAVSTHEVLVADFTLKLMNVRKVNYTGSVVNNMGRLADLYHDL